MFKTQSANLLFLTCDSWLLVGFSFVSYWLD